MMTLEKKQEIFIDEYFIYGWSFKDTYKWISLVGCLYTLAIKKDPNMTVFGLLNKIHPDDVHLSRLFEITQMHVMGHVYKTQDKFPTHGLESSKEIVAEIRRLIADWIPF